MRALRRFDEVCFLAVEDFFAEEDDFVVLFEDVVLVPVLSAEARIAADGPMVSRTDAKIVIAGRVRICVSPWPLTSTSYEKKDFLLSLCSCVREDNPVRWNVNNF
jgi:hypothetical protein